MSFLIVKKYKKGGEKIKKDSQKPHELRLKDSESLLLFKGENPSWEKNKNECHAYSCILDKDKIPYEIINYECDAFIGGLHTAEKTGTPVLQSFMTPVMQGKSKQYYVFVISIADEVDLKVAARAVGEKNVEMLHVRDITAVTGYVRGDCSPLGMKKQFPTIIHESAASYDRIYISGGTLEEQLQLHRMH